MSLSEAYGGKPDYTILSFAQYRQDMERMAQVDKLVYDLRTKVDDDLQLAELIETIKNLPTEKNDSLPNPVVTISKGV